MFKNVQKEYYFRKKLLRFELIYSKKNIGTLNNFKK